MVAALGGHGFSIRQLPQISAILNVVSAQEKLERVVSKNLTNRFSKCPRRASPKERSPIPVNIIARLRISRTDLPSALLKRTSSPPIVESKMGRDVFPIKRYLPFLMKEISTNPHISKCKMGFLIAWLLMSSSVLHGATERSRTSLLERIRGAFVLECKTDKSGEKVTFSYFEGTWWTGFLEYPHSDFFSFSGPQCSDKAHGCFKMTYHLPVWLLQEESDPCQTLYLQISRTILSASMSSGIPATMSLQGCGDGAWIKAATCRKESLTSVPKYPPLRCSREGKKLWPLPVAPSVPHATIKVNPSGMVGALQRIEFHLNEPYAFSDFTIGKPVEGNETVQVQITEEPSPITHACKGQNLVGLSGWKNCSTFVFVPSNRSPFTFDCTFEPNSSATSAYDRKYTADSPLRVKLVPEPAVVAAIRSGGEITIYLTARIKNPALQTKSVELKSVDRTRTIFLRYVGEIRNLATVDENDCGWVECDYSLVKSPMVLKFSFSKPIAPGDHGWDFEWPAGIISEDGVSTSTIRWTSVR